MTLFWRGCVLACLSLAFSITCAQSGERPRIEGTYGIIAGQTLASSKTKPLRRRARRKQSDKFSNILLYTQHGKAVRFYDDLVKDKVVMINLMYTTCPKICPVNTAQLARIHELLERWMGRDITILSLSIDPNVDTPERLKRYWEVFGSKPGWLFLTGDYDEIDRLRHELGVYDLDPLIDADKTQHSGIITIGNDRTDRWIALPILMHTEQLAATVLRNTWDRHWRREPSQTRQLVKNELFRGQGIVRSIDAGNRTVEIDHEEIPGLMPAMAMRFKVANPAMLKGISRGQHVVFRIEHTKDKFRIVAIEPQGD